MDLRVFCINSSQKYRFSANKNKIRQVVFALALNPLNNKKTHIDRSLWNKSFIENSKLVFMIPKFSFLFTYSWESNNCGRSR